MTVDELLQPILKTTLPLKPDDSRQTIPTWDSLAQINIVQAIEDAIGAELSTAEVLSLKSVSNIIEVSRAHGLELTVVAG